STKTSDKTNEHKEIAKRAKNMRYLIAHKRSCSPQGTLIWGILSALAILLVSSCKAPKGHSQPQNAPRPQKISAIAMAHHSMKISGSMRKASQEKPSRNAVVKVSTLTTEGWAVIIQPSQIRVMVRYTVRIRSSVRSYLTIRSWKKKIPVNVSSMNRNPAQAAVLLFHMRTHSGVPSI